jgi:NADPH:quinone reductase-like Zn-dependent oxidoreductase
MKPLPGTMKAVVLTGHGSRDKLEYMDYPVPEIESGKIAPSLYATYLLSEFHWAQTDFMAKKYIGKLVVMPDKFFEKI